MKRFALFGHAGQRRKSVAGLLSMVFVAYLMLGLFAARILGDQSWFEAAFLNGLVVIMIAGIPFLRARFLASQSSQLALLYESLSRQKRRRTLLAIVIAFAVSYGIAGIVYRDTGDIKVFLSPLAIAVSCFWIYMLAISLYLGALWLSDTWGRLMKTNVPREERGISLTMIALPTGTGLALAVGLYNNHSFAWLAFFAGFVVTAFVYFRRYQLGASLAFAAMGSGLLLFDVYTRSPGDELTLGQLGLILAVIGLGGALLRGLGEFQKYWQRRRVSRLLGQNSP